MRNEKRIRCEAIAALILNALTLILVTFSVLWFFLIDSPDADTGNMSTMGTGCFRYFTNDSNIFAAFVSLLLIPYEIKTALCTKNKIPEWLLTLKAVSTAAVTLTMTVVLFFLGPTQGYGKMLSGVCLPLHLLCPLFAISSYCFFERGRAIGKRKLLLCTVPTLVYGTVYLVCVVFFEIWQDFYGFNIGGYWYVSYLLLPVITYLLALLLRLLHNRFAIEK